MKPQLVILLFLAMNLSSLSAIQHPKSIEKWEVSDLRMNAEEAPEDPFAVELGAIFTHESGEDMRVPGFFNGNREWLLRFCPPKSGIWTFQTYSSLPEFAGKRGKIEVKPNTREWQRGPIVIDPENPQQFAYADGSPYFLLAFELDWLFALDAKNREEMPKTREIIKEVAQNGFNHIVMNVFAYDASWGEREKAKPEHLYAEPEVFPFGGTNTDPDHSTLNVSFFQHLDRVISHLDEKEIVAHLMIYVWNKKVNWPDPESEDDNRYFDYVVKRYQAYPNLIWDISKEALAYGRDDMGYITRRIERLRRLDGHKRLLSVHDYNYCNAFPDKVDFISIQEWEPYLYYRMVEVREKHSGKPIFNIEHGGYEKTTYSIFDGAYTDPVVCLDRNYQCVFAGTYSTYYWQNTSWYNVIFNPSELPVEEQPHFDYYRNMVRFFEQYPYNGLKPRQNAFSPPYLTDGNYTCIFYLGENRSGIHGALEDFRGKTMKVSWFDPLTGIFHDGGEHDFGDNTWIGLYRPEIITGPLSIAVLKEVSGS